MGRILGLITALGLTIGSSAFFLTDGTGWQREEIFAAAGRSQNIQKIEGAVLHATTYAADGDELQAPNAVVITGGVFNKNSVLYGLNQALDPASTSGGLYPLRKMTEQLAIWIMLPLILLSIFTSLARQGGGDRALTDVAKRIVVVVIMLWLYIPWDVITFRVISQPLAAALESDNMRMAVVSGLYQRRGADARDVSLDEYAYGDSTSRASGISQDPSMLGTMSRFGQHSTGCASSMASQSTLDPVAPNSEGKAMLKKCVGTDLPVYEQGAQMFSIGSMNTGEKLPTTKWEATKLVFKHGWQGAKWAYRLIIQKDWTVIAEILMATFVGLMTMLIHILMAAAIWFVWLGVIIGRAFSLVLAPLVIVWSLGPGGDSRAKAWFKGHAKMCLRPVGISLAMIFFFALFGALVATPTLNSATASSATGGQVYASISSGIFSQVSAGVDTSATPPVTLPPGYDGEDPEATPLDTAQQRLADELEPEKSIMMGLSLRLTLVLIFLVMIRQSDKMVGAMAGDVTELAAAMGTGVRDKAWRLAKTTGKGVIKGSAAAATGGAALAAQKMKQVGTKATARQASNARGREGPNKARGPGGSASGRAGPGFASRVAGEFGDSMEATKWAWAGGNEGNQEIDQSGALSILGTAAAEEYGALNRKPVEAQGAESALTDGSQSAMSGLAQLALSGIGIPAAASVEAGDMWAVETALEDLSYEEREITIKTSEAIIAGIGREKLEGMLIGVNSPAELQASLSALAPDIHEALADDPGLAADLREAFGSESEDMPVATTNGQEVPDILAMAGMVPAIALAFQLAAAGGGGYFREKNRREELTRASGFPEGSIRDKMLHMMDDRLLIGYKGDNKNALLSAVDKELRRLWYRQASKQERRAAGLTVLADGDLGETMAAESTFLDNQVEWLRTAHGGEEAEEVMLRIGLTFGSLITQLRGQSAKIDRKLARSSYALTLGLDVESYLRSSGSDETYKAESGSIFSKMAEWRRGASGRDVYASAREAVEKAWKDGAIRAPTRGENESWDAFSERKEVEVNRLIFGSTEGIVAEEIIRQMRHRHVPSVYSAMAAKESELPMRTLIRSGRAIGLQIEEPLTAAFGSTRVVPNSPLAIALLRLEEMDETARGLGLAQKIEMVLPDVMKQAGADLKKKAEKRPNRTISTFELSGAIGLVAAVTTDVGAARAAIIQAWAERDLAQDNSAGGKDFEIGGGGELWGEPGVTEDKNNNSLSTQKEIRRTAGEAEVAPLEEVGGSQEIGINQKANNSPAAGSRGAAVSDGREPFVAPGDPETLSPSAANKGKRVDNIESIRIIESLNKVASSAGISVAAIKAAEGERWTMVLPGSPLELALHTLGVEGEGLTHGEKITKVLPVALRQATGFGLTQDEAGGGRSAFTVFEIAAAIGLSTENFTEKTQDGDGRGSIEETSFGRGLTASSDIENQVPTGPYAAGGEGRDETTDAGGHVAGSAGMVEAGSILGVVQSDAAAARIPENSNAVYKEAVERLKQAWEAGVVTPASPRRAEETARDYDERVAETVVRQVMDPLLGEALVSLSGKQETAAGNAGIIESPVKSKKEEGLTQLGNINQSQAILGGISRAITESFAATAKQTGVQAERLEAREPRDEDGAVIQKRRTRSATAPDSPVSEVHVVAEPAPGMATKDSNGSAGVGAGKTAEDDESKASRAQAETDLDSWLPAPATSNEGEAERAISRQAAGLRFDPGSLRLVAADTQQSLISERIRVMGATGAGVAMLSEPVFGTSKQGWVKAKFNDSAAPTAILVEVDPRGLGGGEYWADITVTIEGGAGRAEIVGNVTVYLTITGVGEGDIPV